MAYNRDLPTGEYLEFSNEVARDQADTRYAVNVYPWWNNLNDKVAYERMFAEGHPVKMREAQAMISQNPLTSRDEIRNNMTARGVPSKYGYPTEELTINDVLNQDFRSTGAHDNDRLWNDFSESSGEINATQRPDGTMW
jgi:hypothetical protein